MLFSRKVKVTFIDEASGAVIGETSMDPAQLPESFLHDTTLHLGDQPWSVRKAEPPTREQYARSRRLVLTLARTATIDPRELLFSLPTINDRLPDEEGQADGSEVVLLEDDWRQVEWVHVSRGEVITEELQSVRRIYEEHRQGIGFDQIHVRSRLAEPLPGAPLKAEALLRLVLGPPLPLRLDRHGVRIRGGFAYSLPAGWILYGTRTEQHVEVLGLHRSGEPLPDDTAAALEDLAAEHHLLLVDWCRCAAGEPGDPSFRAVIGAAR